MTRFFLIVLLSFFSIMVLKGHDTSYQTKVQRLVALLESAHKQSRKNFVGALTDAQAALTLAEALRSTHYKIKAHSTIGTVYEHHVRFNEAAPHYKLAFELSQNQPEDSLQISAAIEWAGICTETYQFDTAFKIYQKVLAKAEKAENKVWIAWICNDWGLLYEKVGQPDKSVELYLKSTSVSESMGDKEQAAISLGNAIKVYITIRNFDLALEIIERLYKIAYASKLPYRIASALSIHGSILAGLSRYDEALSKHLAALKMYEDLGDKRYLIRSLNRLQDVYLKQKNYVKAEESLKRCLTYNAYCDDEDRAIVYNYQGKLYQETNREEAAIKVFEQAILFAKRNNMTSILQVANRKLAEIYEQKKQSDKAYKYLLASTVFADSLIAKERRQHLAEAQFKNNLQASEHEIEVLKGQKTRNWLIAVGILLLFTIVALSIIAFIKRKAHRNLLQKNAEIKLQNERLETSNETLRQFAYVSAHDLKEPLRSIGSFIKIIEKRYVSQLPPEATEYMGFVSGGVKRMENLLVALLEYATLASDATIEVKEATALTSVFDDVKMMLSGIISEKKVIIKQNGVFPALFISRVHLIQIIQNLVSNAIKFSNSTPIIAIEGQINDEQFFLTLTDNGIGIKKEHGNKIFRLFQRLDKTPQYEGTGIGLAICRQIVEKYGGRIWFESELGEGTTFFITLPLNIVQNAATQAPKVKRITAFLS